MAIELLQLHDRQAREHAAAEKQEARIEPTPPNAGRAMQLRAAPMENLVQVSCVGNVGGAVESREQRRAIGVVLRS